MLLVVTRLTYWLDAHRGWNDLPFAFGAPDPHGILGESPAMWKLREAIQFAAQSPQHVLVQGESGSGKELVARALHALSPPRRPLRRPQRRHPPEGLADAELFGTIRGYPDAHSPERPGLIGTANGGTLFLDELPELPHDLQSHFLRVLAPGTTLP